MKASIEFRWPAAPGVVVAPRVADGLVGQPPTLNLPSGPVAARVASADVADNGGAIAVLVEWDHPGDVLAAWLGGGTLAISAAMPGECTGLGAAWCPVHGDCACPRDEETGLPLGDLDSPGCPLHGHESDHAA